MRDFALCGGLDFVLLYVSRHWSVFASPLLLFRAACLLDALPTINTHQTKQTRTLVHAFGPTHALSSPHLVWLFPPSFASALQPLSTPHPTAEHTPPVRHTTHNPTPKCCHASSSLPRSSLRSLPSLRPRVRLRRWPGACCAALAAAKAAPRLSPPPSACVICRGPRSKAQSSSMAAITST